MRTAFFWVITQRLVEISCRRFGTAYRTYQCSRTQKTLLPSLFTSV